MYPKNPALPRLFFAQEQPGAVALARRPFLRNRMCGGRPRASTPSGDRALPMRSILHSKTVENTMNPTDSKLHPWEGASKPAAVFIELTSHCNMKCKFCPSEILTRKRSRMRPDVVFRILEECRGNGVPVTFHILGEPFLNPHFFEYAEFCDKEDIKYELTTNATLCTEELTEKLFCLKNLTNVYVAFHTFDAESFKLRGTAMDFEDYMRNIENLIFSQKRYENGKILEIPVMYDAHDKRLWGNFTDERWQGFTARVRQWQERLLERFPDVRERFPFFFFKS